MLLLFIGTVSRCDVMSSACGQVFAGSIKRNTAPSVTVTMFSSSVSVDFSLSRVKV